MIYHSMSLGLPRLSFLGLPLPGCRGWNTHGGHPTNPKHQNSLEQIWKANKQVWRFVLSLSSMVNSKHTLLLLQHDKNQKMLNARNIAGFDPRRIWPTTLISRIECLLLTVLFRPHLGKFFENVWKIFGKKFFSGNFSETSETFQKHRKFSGKIGKLL